uniref:Reverse transcriptase n=1 Tax=Hirondellea gigas TaxID=1518452 RepID=A0A6A7G2U0_9CRUS
MEMFSRLGLPSEILHDQGTNFMSRVMQKFNELLQIKRINTTAWNPKCNGSCENFNKTLKQMLKKVCADEPDNWDRYLHPLLFAYRKVPQVTTGFSPFELLFGYEVRGPLFLIKDRFLSVDGDEEEIAVTEYVLQIREKLRQYLELSGMSNELAKSKQKVYYDRLSRSRKFQPGDKVLMLLPTSTNKLLAEWKGPFEIVRKLNKVDYIIRVGDKEKSYHINMLKLFRERKPQLANLALQSNNELVKKNCCTKFRYLLLVKSVLHWKM